MKERPILFSGPMVRAILEGRKTQTRRVVKPQPEIIATLRNVIPRPNAKGSCALFAHIDDDGVHSADLSVYCPYGMPGDRLWVRETWARTRIAQCPGLGEIFVYDACDNRTDYGGPWKPSIHMPRAASRILLEITAVRVERLQDISESDCIAEGIPSFSFSGTPYEHYQWLWESINGRESWDANLWVWVIEFKRVKP